jgi:CPA1 family monovalent cation:H+ antiporter
MLADTGLLPSSVLLVVIILSFLGAVLSDKLKVSYTAVLVGLGFGLSLLRISDILMLNTLSLSRSVILGLVVPPLIFEAAMRTRYEIFTTVRTTVLLLAILGVIISALLTGFVLNTVLGLPLAVALTFGVIVSPTDPVSVVNLLRRTKAPERLVTILESEAYFNDATAVILFPIVVSLTFDPLQSAASFVFVLGGGVLVGALVSGIAELLYRLVTEPLAETYFTIAVMFGSYLLAETLGVSGLVAVAIAGIYMGNRTMRFAMSHETRSTVTKFWDVLTFIVTSLAFLLLGLRSDAGLLLAFSPFILVAFAVIVLARFVSVYPIVGVTRVLGENISKSWSGVLGGAGLRGVVSVALALSLPDSFPYRSAIVAMTFGVALLSLVIQGELLQWYLKKAKLGG